MKKILTVLMSAFLLTGAISCKKSSDGNNNNTNSGAKSIVIKITLSPVPGTNQGSFTGAVNAMLPGTDLATWKVNDVVRSNETTIGFTTADFKNGVLTLETTAPVTITNLSVSGVTTAQFPYTATVQWTLGGKANDPISLPVTSTMTRSYEIK
ncbi:hypothetical protein Niako_5177 [Niastella koreensis GR20-10]|uniref:Lipocalin-like domain-containing protein n=2 Tax=Niastella koreensis TaxID=354356 RepID=G8TCA8_NIAKG|nr:hypothetical protein [Niastella koreensis]AEW01415.1 hypothetical protein Niako_5177 [Niastella koreensis GR20-10]